MTAKTRICQCIVLAVVGGFLLFGAPVLGDSPSEPIILQPGCELIFADIPTGQRILTEKDMFTRAVGPYLKAVALNTADSVTTDEYLDFLRAQVREWTESDKELIRRAAMTLAPKLKSYHLHLPERIVLIKTTGKDMQECAYCRYCSIVFPEPMIFQYGDLFERILTHELFHVYSRYNLDWRTDLYGLLDFKPCNEIKLPDVIARREMTNPDAPLNNYYVRIPTRDGDDLCVIPLMLGCQADYEPRAIHYGWMDMTPTQLLVVEQQDEQWVPKLKDGRPVLLNMADAMGFFKCVGLNTTYVLGAEEILAENFTMLIQEREGLPSPEIVERVKTFLLSHQAKEAPW